MPLNPQPNIAIIGLGYVGLPLAAAFGTRFDTVGFDIDATRIAQLRDGTDRTRELEPEDFTRAGRSRCAFPTHCGRCR